MFVAGRASQSYGQQRRANGLSHNRAGQPGNTVTDDFVPYDYTKLHLES